MNQETTKKILQETEEGYDLVASKFSETRKHFWRGLEFIGGYAKEGDKVLDFGSGNGRLLELFKEKNIDYLGVDVSQKLVDTAKQKYPNAKFSKIDPLETTLPFADNYFNTVYSIAVFHHFPSQKYRENIAKELHRITKDGGKIIITVWNLHQKKYIKNILQNLISRILGKSELDWNDCYISFTDNQSRKFQRFHHAFTKSEIKKLFMRSGFKKVKKCEIIKKRNILLIAEK